LTFNFDIFDPQQTNSKKEKIICVLKYFFVFHCSLVVYLSKCANNLPFQTVFIFEVLKIKFDTVSALWADPLFLPTVQCVSDFLGVLTNFKNDGCLGENSCFPPHVPPKPMEIFGFFTEVFAESSFLFTFL